MTSQIVPLLNQESQWILLNQDSRESHLNSQIDVIITEAPNLKDMPKREIEKAINRFKPKYSIVFCDLELNLDYPCIQYPWDLYIKRKDFIIPRLIYGTHTGDVILDPFSGYGSIGLIALGMYRRFIGIEINEKIHNIALTRINECMNHTI